jgi:hypothetical protein
MISYSLLVCLIGLLLWLIFTKWSKVADAWVAELGRLSFFAGLLAYLIALGAKAFLDSTKG